MNISDFKLGMAFQRYLVEAQIPADARVLFTTLPDTTVSWAALRQRKPLSLWD